MKALFHRSLMLPAGALCITLLCWTAVEPAFPATSSSSTPRSVKRWAQFELSEKDSTGELQAGKPLTLTITLGGVVRSSVPVEALCESILFEPQTVTLEPDPELATLKATVTLEPFPKSRTSVPQKAARIQVTFGRFRQDKFERFMKRIVYVTLGHEGAAGDTNEPAAVRPEEPAAGDLIVDEVQPEVKPVSSGELAEEDLLPLADPARGKAYWHQVSLLVSRSWARQVRGVRHGPSSETVKVRFKLYPSGRAQLIEIEKGSGAREIDEAGIYAVVNAQPFPEFPEELGSEAVDVHVRMRTGVRAKSREVQSVGNQSSATPDAPPASKK